MLNLGKDKHFEILIYIIFKNLCLQYITLGCIHLSSEEEGEWRSFENLTMSRLCHSLAPNLPISLAIKGKVLEWPTISSPNHFSPISPPHLHLYPFTCPQLLLLSSHLISSSLYFPNMLGSLPYLLQVFTRMSPQWGLPWPSYLKLHHIPLLPPTHMVSSLSLLYFSPSHLSPRSVLCIYYCTYCLSPIRM